MLAASLHDKDGSLTPLHTLGLVRAPMRLTLQEVLRDPWPKVTPRGGRPGHMVSNAVLRDRDTEAQRP